jgi:hypothetical protein
MLLGKYFLKEGKILVHKHNFQSVILSKKVADLIITDFVLKPVFITGNRLKVDIDRCAAESDNSVEVVVCAADRLLRAAVATDADDAERRAGQADYSGNA